MDHSENITGDWRLFDLYQQNLGATLSRFSEIYVPPPPSKDLYILDTTFYIICLKPLYIVLYGFIKAILFVLIISIGEIWAFTNEWQNMCSVHETFFATSDISTNIFLIKAGHFYTTSDFLTMNKAEMFINAQVKLVKMTSRMLTNIRQM